MIQICPITGSQAVTGLRGGRNSILDTTVFEYSTLWLVLSVLSGSLVRKQWLLQTVLTNYYYYQIEETCQ